MTIDKFQSINPGMGETRTYESFSKWLGSRPARLGVVSRLYENLTASYLTESLRNVFYRDRKATDKFRSLDAMYFDWEIETNNIKRIEFAEVPSEDGSNGTEITMAFKENYYGRNDIFKIDGSEQQCFVVSRPVRKSDHYFEVNVRLLDNDYTSVLDTRYCQVGCTTRWIGNAQPELHREGNIKYQSNINKQRNWITCHRVEDSYSSLYACHEDMFVKVGNGEGNSSETIYKLNKKEKELLDNFMFARNNMLLFSKCNVAPKTGKPTIYDNETGEPIYIGDGLIPQVERYASKYAFNTMNMGVLQTVISSMAEKAENPVGNTFTFIVNERFWQIMQSALGKWLSDNKTDGAYLWSQKANDYVKVGATYNAYEWAGNTIIFTVDRTFSREYGFEKGYAVCIDLTSDSTKAEAPVSMFTLKGLDYVTNFIEGVGGKDGMSSGAVSSPVAASRVITWGYSGIAVFNPYKSFILREI